MVFSFTNTRLPRYDWAQGETKIVTKIIFVYKFGYNADNQQYRSYMEKQVENTLIRHVERLGGMCLKFPPIFFAGFPDRIVLLPGALIVFVELKAPGKKPRKLQEKIHARLRRLGFRVEVLDTVTGVETFILTL